MRDKLIQLVAVIVAPLLTWFGANLVASRLQLPGRRQQGDWSRLGVACHSRWR
jgi:hypothetical protein